MVLSRTVTTGGCITGPRAEQENRTRVEGTTMGSPDRDSPARRRIVSISFDSADAEWVDLLVAVLRQAGYSKAARAEIVRTALQELHKVLVGRTHAEIVKFFLDREAERLLAPFDEGPKLPPT